MSKPFHSNPRLTCDSHTPPNDEQKKICLYLFKSVKQTERYANIKKRKEKVNHIVPKINPQTKHIEHLSMSGAVTLVSPPADGDRWMSTRTVQR